PIAKEDLTNTKNRNLRFRGNIYSELDFLKMIKYKFNFGFDFSNDNHEYLRKYGSWSLNQPEDPSSLNRNQAQYRGLTFDNTLEFTKAFDKHNINVLLGTSYLNNNYEQLWGTKSEVMTSGSLYYH